MLNTKKSSIQGTVRIDPKLHDFVSEWLKTDHAKSLGFHSKAHLVTQAVRDLVYKYTGLRCMLIGRHLNNYTLYDNGLNAMVKITINKVEHALECTTCKSFDCHHVFFIWLNSDEEEYLRKNTHLSNPIKNLR